MTLKFYSLLEVVKVHVRIKFNQAKCGGLWVIVLTTFCNTRNGKRFKNLVLWSSPLTYDLQIQTFFKKISKYVLVKNFIKLSAAICKLSLSCWQRNSKPSLFTKLKATLSSLPRTVITHFFYIIFYIFFVTLCMHVKQKPLAEYNYSNTWML